MLQPLLNFLKEDGWMHILAIFGAFLFCVAADLIRKWRGR